MFRLSSGSLAMIEINFLSKHRDFGSFTYSQQTICISIKTYQYKEKQIKKRKALMQFRKCIVLATWLHVAGRCFFRLCQTVAIYISLRDVLRVFNFSPTLFKVQKVNRMKYVACTIMHKAQHEI